MRLGVRRFGEAPVERRENLVLAAERAAVVEQERRDTELPGSPAQRRALGRVDRDLAGDEVEPELGQPLADAVRVGAPFGLIELDHRR